MTLRPLAAWLVSLLLIGGVLACAPTSGPVLDHADDRPAPGLAGHDPAWDSDSALCARAGGAIRRVGLMNMPYCVIPMPDAGKVCTDKADCTGRCIQFDISRVGKSTTGVCQRENVQFGCFSEVKDGRAQPALCAD